MNFNNSGKAARLGVAVTLLVASILFYFVYQEIQIVYLAIISILSFSCALYLVRKELYRFRILEPFAKILPYIIIGAFASVILVTLGIQISVANSYYSSLLSFVSSRFAAFLLSMTGAKIEVAGNILYFPNGNALSVGPMCSGAYSSLLFGLLSFVMVADVGRRAPKGRLLVVLILGVAFAYLSNMLRITFLASLMYLFGLTTMDIAHQFAGYGIFLSFISLFWIFSLKWLATGRATRISS